MIKLTEKAAKEVKEFMTDSKEKLNLRIGVSGGGCSGFNYSLSVEPASDFDESNDSQTIQHGIVVVVDKKSALFLDGTTLDYHDGLEFST